MNLQEKLSGLKGLVSHSHSKRRFKGDLTLDMISPPLGDFRHTMHVGRGGDVFGDTSFLSNHGGTANGNNWETDSISSPDNKIGDLSPPPPVVSPIIKNAISLPRLDVDMPNGSPTAKVLFPQFSKHTRGEEKLLCGNHLKSCSETHPSVLPSNRDRFSPDVLMNHLGS
uniref:CDC42 effector protein (Rho GTPase binding) 1a n=1 Tax=Sander lucioperca TaxID=283035 RepID=A0A8C9X727_SANLU